MSLDKGMCFCTECFSVFPADKAVFKAELSMGNTKIPLYLRWGVSGIRYGLDVRDGQGRKYIVVKRPEITREEGFGGPIRSIKAIVRGTDAEKEESIKSDSSKRYCPCCQERGKDIRIHDFMGYTDSYFINLVGLRAVGKTSFAKAIRHPTNISLMSRVLGREVNAYMSSERSIAEATPDDQFFLTALQIQVRNRPITIFFSDVAGESYVRKTNGAHDYGNAGNSDFQIDLTQMVQHVSDAILVLHDLRDLGVHDEDPTEKDLNLNMINPILRGVQNKGTKVVCVLTKGDKYQEYIEEHGNVLDRNGQVIATSHSPVFTAAEKDCDLPLTDTEEAVMLARHMACANDIMRSVVRGSVTIQKDTPCFIVSAGETSEINTIGNAQRTQDNIFIVEEASQTVIDYSKSCNVILPLLYLIRSWI